MLNFLDLLAIVAYFLILLFIGLRVMRSTKSDEEIESLTQRVDDPLVSRVAAKLLFAAVSESIDEQSEISRIGLYTVFLLSYMFFLFDE